MERERVGRRLKSGIADNGMTAKELAVEIGVSYETLKNYMAGETPIGLEKAVRICDIFGWPLDKLAVRGEYRD